MVPTLPAPDKTHKLLLVDVQLRTDVAPLAIEDCDAVRVTTGTAAPTLTVVL